MSEVKHTPGPWSFKRMDNSRLIAAAPALLEALETMLKGDELGEFECQRQGFPRWIERQEKARAALALAKEGK